MSSSASSASSQQPLQNSQFNNQYNNGLIGNGFNNIVNSGNNNQVNQFNITHVAKEEEEVVELDMLFAGYASKDALRNYFHSPPECHPNTRTTVLNEIGGWIDESKSKKSPLLWLNGPAAVGKSVIAKTISGFHNQIVAAFFFSTSSDRSAATLFPTLAWQMARRIPDTRKHIIASLKNSGSLQTSQVEEQFDSLIIQPLKKSAITSKSRPIMVIDGADECTDESMLLRFLRSLVQASEGDDMPLRFIVCSRPEPRIRAILGRARDVKPTTNGQEQQAFILVSIGAILVVFFVAVGSVMILIPTSLIQSFRSEAIHPTQIQQNRSFLQDIWELYRPIRLGVDKDVVSSKKSDEPTNSDTLDTILSHSVISTLQIGFSKECKEDIARYLTDKFNAVRSPGEGTGSWLQPCDISDLAEASCGQFLYASTIVRLLDEPDFDPRDALEMARRGSLPTPDLDELYKKILKRAQETAKKGGAEYRTEWRFVMDSLAILIFFAGNDHIFTVRKNFPVIENLLGLQSGKLTLKLCKMHSVLRIVPGESIQVHHRSFLEFLRSKRCSEEYFTAYPTAMQLTLHLMGRAIIRDGIIPIVK